MIRRSMVMAASFVAMSTCSGLALAEEETTDAPPKKASEMVTVAPTVGWLGGKWMGQPITRIAAGIDAVVMPSSKSDVGADVIFFVAPGSTENGLDANRVELGLGATSRPGLFRLAGGAHLSYAWLSRKTMPGTIGGVGVGLHALVEGAIPLGERVALTVGLRGSVDVYDGGRGYEAGPFAGFRF